MPHVFFSKEKKIKQELLACISLGLIPRGFSQCFVCAYMLVHLLLLFPLFGHHPSMCTLYLLELNYCTFTSDKLRNYIKVWKTLPRWPLQMSLFKDVSEACPNFWCQRWRMAYSWMVVERKKLKCGAWSFQMNAPPYCQSQ